MAVKHVSNKGKRDKAVIIDLVRRLGPISRVDLHELTRLRPGTISALTRELLREKQLLEVGPSDNPTGRKQVLLRLNEDSSHIAALAFGADRVTAAAVDLGANVKQSLSEPAYVEGGVEGLVKQLIRCTEAVGARNLAGIGIGDPGVVDSRAGVSIASSTIEFWKSVPLGKIFESHFRVPVLLESNTRACAVAERMRGAGRMAEDLLFLEYGTGIGLAIFSEGRLLRGSGQSAGELGHTHVLDGGPPCKCGNFGCLEAVIGEPALAARARSAILERGKSLVLNLSGGDPEKITGWNVIEAAAQGDKMCTMILAEVEKYLGLALSHAVNLFNPSLVLIDRRLSRAPNGFLDQIARIVRHFALPHATDRLEFRFSELGVEAGVLGVALLVLERHFEIPALKLPKFMTEPAQSFRRGRAGTLHNQVVKSA